MATGIKHTRHNYGDRHQHGCTWEQAVHRGDLEHRERGLVLFVAASSIRAERRVSFFFGVQIVQLFQEELLVVVPHGLVPVHYAVSRPCLKQWRSPLQNQCMICRPPFSNSCMTNRSQVSRGNAMATEINTPGITMATGINMPAWERVRSACYADRHKHNRHSYGDRHDHVCMDTSEGRTSVILLNQMLHECRCSQ